MVFVSKRVFRKAALDILSQMPSISVEDFVNEILEEIERDEEGGAVGGGGRGGIPIDADSLLSSLTALCGDTGNISADTIDTICSQIEDEYHRSLFLLFTEVSPARRRRSRSAPEHITVNDVRTASRKVGMELSDGDAAMMIEEFDSEGRGGVTLEEFVAILREAADGGPGSSRKSSSAKVTRARDLPEQATPTTNKKAKATKGTKRKGR